MKFSKEQLLLYAITDSQLLKDKDIAREVENAILGGATCIQLREKHLPEEELIERAKLLCKVCHRYDVPLIVNDSYKAAMSAGADGVHVGLEDTPVAMIRHEAGADFIIGATAKTKEQALLAQAQGADYIGVGAVFSSPTKKNALRITPEQLSEICRCVKIPAVAIGGIDLQNLSRIKGCGQQGIAVVSAIFGTEDTAAAARALRQALG